MASMTYRILDSKDQAISNGSANLSNLLTNGVLVSEDVRKESSLTPFTLMGQNSDQVAVGDFGGALRNIEISGVRVGTQDPDNTGTTELGDFAGALDKLVQGNQIPSKNFPVKYTSGILGVINVKITSVNYRFLAGKPRILAYTIRMIEAAQQQ